MRRLAALALGLWLLAAPALAQSVVPVQMVDANLTTTNAQNFVSTSNTFTAPRILTVVDRSSLNSYYIQFIDTANAVNGINTLTINVQGGALINGSATYVVSQPGAYVFLTPNASGYKATAFFNQIAPAAPGGSSGQVQYNNTGAFAGIANVTSNGTNIALGTPLSGTLTNTTGFPVANLAGVGAGCVTWLATPSSANLRGCLTDETGTGIAYFVGGALGTPASATLTNATGLPIAGTTGYGTGIAAVLALQTNATNGLYTNRPTTVQVLTSGTGATYTTGAGARYIVVYGCGGGGGGGTAGGTSGSNTTWSSPAMTGAGGAVTTGVTGNAALGGIGTGGQINYIGGDGIGTFTGVASMFLPRLLGGGSIMSPPVVSPAANTCAGGGSNQVAGAGSTGGSGAGGGGFRRIIPAPAVSYTYTIGSGGTAGTGGIAGGSGVIIVEEY